MKVKRSILFLLVLILINCKNKVDNKANQVQLLEKEIKTELNKESKYSIDDFQGIWESFSYYLEHESEFKDFNQNKYYKIIFNNKSLDIKLEDQNINNTSISRYHLGFFNSPKKISSKKLFLENLKISGNLLVRLNEDTKEYNYLNIEKSSNFERYFDVTEILNDGFIYEKISDDFNFKTLPTLPQEVFSKLIEKSKLNNIDYIKEYNIYKFSEKAKVKVDKSYFHTKTTEESKRKAFLVKGDIAYVEEILDGWIKVYYNGSIVSGGFIKRSDLEILN